MYDNYINPPIGRFFNEINDDNNLINQSFSLEESSNKYFVDKNIFSTKDSLAKQEESEIDNYQIISIKPKTKKVKHDKYANDNKLKKSKTLTIRNFLDWFNKKLTKIYNDPNDPKKNIMKLSMIDPKETEDSTIEFNRQYINKPMKEIFSVKVSNKCTATNKLKNTQVIEIILNEIDENKRKPLEKPLNYRYKDCAKYLGGERDGLEELAGLESNERWLKFIKKNDEKYIKEIKHTMINLEQILNEKRPRKKRINEKKKSK